MPETEKKSRIVGCYFYADTFLGRLLKGSPQFDADAFSPSRRKKAEHNSLTS
jgi:hypothetical protein